MIKGSNANVVVRKDAIEVKLTEAQTAETLMLLKEQIIEWSKDRHYNIIVDVVEARLGTKETRLASERFFEGLPYRRFAIWGGSPPINLSIKLLVEAHADGEHVRMFRREEDARVWLKEKE
jgi:hypothetical protein